MSPKPERKPDRDGTPAVRALPEPPELTTELLARHIDRARLERALAIQEYGRRACKAVGRLFRPAADREPAVVRVAHRLSGPLTSIRASAEILRDHPDIDPRERHRFLEIVLTEEARMEELVAELVEVGSRSGNRRTGQAA